MRLGAGHRLLPLLLGGVLLLMLTSLCGCSIYMVHTSLAPNEAYHPYDEKALVKQTKNRFPFLTAWLDSLQGHDALRDTFVQINGKKEHAYFVYAQHPSPRTAFIIHGYKDCALGMFSIGYLYHHDLGYNIFLPDLYAHGASDGGYIRMGWKDRLDVLQWIPLADSLFGGQTSMVLHGISMGAATTMMVSGEETPVCVKAFVEDCGYTSVWDEFAGELKKQYKLPKFPLLYTASGMNWLMHGWTFRQASALKQVRKCQKPMLFIHGDKDDYVPTKMVYPLYEAKPGVKKLWLAPGSGHARSYTDHREEYTRRVGEFLEKNL